MEPGYHHNIALSQLRLQAVGLNVLDPSRAVHRVGVKSGLPAQQADHRKAHTLNGHGQQRNGDLLPGGQQLIHFSGCCVGVDLFGLFNQIIGGIALGGHHDNHIIAGLISVRHDACHIVYTLGIGY